MQRRTLQILGLGLPVTLAVSAVVLAQSDHTSTVSPSSQLLAAPSKTTAVVSSTAVDPTPSWSINGQAVPVKPNATTHYNDGTTQTTISSSSSGPDQSSQTSSTQGQSPATTVDITQTSNGGSSSSSVSTSGNSTI